MQQGKTHFKRRNYFIQKKFQTAFIAKFCLILLATGLLSGIILYTFTGDTLTASFQNSRLAIEKTSTTIFPSLLYAHLLALLAAICGAALVFLFVSHKIAGPLYRLEKEMQGIASGDLTRRVIFREKDQIAPLAGQLNLMNDALRDKVLIMRDEIWAVRSLAQKPEATLEELGKRLEALERTLENSFIV